MSPAKKDTVKKSARTATAKKPEARKKVVKEVKVAQVPASLPLPAAEPITREAAALLQLAKILGGSFLAISIFALLFAKEDAGDIISSSAWALMLLGIFLGYFLRK